jgi:hypothetical protein
MMTWVRSDNFENTFIAAAAIPHQVGRLFGPPSIV